MRLVVFLVIAVRRSQVDDDVPRDITGPEWLPSADVEPIREWGWLLAAVLIAGLSIGLIASWILNRKSIRTRPIIRAIRQLDRLQRLQLLSKNQPEKHFTLLAGIARRFVKSNFGVAARRLTTGEFLEAARHDPRLEPHVSFLQYFLHECDVAKFAPPTAIADVGRDLDARLREWLAFQTATENPPALDAFAPSSKMSDS
jgi:hypothetical protein